MSIVSTGKIRVEGEVHGNVFSTEVIISDGGTVTGVIAADLVTIFDSVMGTIRAQQVVLEAGAKVDGDVHHQTLSIDQRAQLEGRVRRVRDPSELKVAPEPNAAPPVELAPPAQPAETPQRSSEAPEDASLQGSRFWR